MQPEDGHRMVEVPPGMDKEQQVMNALHKHVQGKSPSPKEQLAGNVARHYVNGL